jgi:hypothetical protein
MGQPSPPGRRETRWPWPGIHHVTPLDGAVAQRNQYCGGAC